MEHLSLEEYLGAIKHQTQAGLIKFVQVDLLILLCILRKFCELLS